MAVIAACPLQVLHAQDLAPRAYIFTPVHWNAVTLTYSFSDGGVSTDNAVPIADATAVLHVPIFNYFHSLNFFGRSANILASLPYGVAHYQGTFMDNEKKIYRSGLLDSVFRFSVNLKGGPAMRRVIHEELNLTDPRIGKLPSGTAVSRNIPERACAEKRN